MSIIHEYRFNIKPTTKISSHSQFTLNPDKLDKDAHGLLKDVREVY